MEGCRINGTRKEYSRNMGPSSCVYVALSLETRFNRDYALVTLIALFELGVLS